MQEHVQRVSSIGSVGIDRDAASHLKIRGLHQNFGAEISGIDLLGAPSQADIAAVQRALAAYQLLVFRFDQPIPPDRQVEITSWFGRPVKNNGDKAWSVLHNKDPAGAARLAFHSDFTYTDSPIKVISLQAIEVPSSGTSTSFLSGVHAWETLPAHLQALLSPMTVRHVQDSSLVSHDLPIFIADQPVRYDHPRMQKPVLLVTEYHARRINELSPEKSGEVLALLFQHLYRPENVYVHDWRLYDFLLWDNLAVQHSRTQRADPRQGARAMQRVAINEESYEALIARARAQQQERQLLN